MVGTILMSLKNNNTRETKYDAIRFYGELFEKGEAATGSSFFFFKKKDLPQHSVELRRIIVTLQRPKCVCVGYIQNIIT